MTMTDYKIWQWSIEQYLVPKWGSFNACCVYILEILGYAVAHQLKSIICRIWVLWPKMIVSATNIYGDAGRDKPLQPNLFSFYFGLLCLERAHAVFRADRDQRILSNLQSFKCMLLKKSKYIFDVIWRLLNENN